MTSVVGQYPEIAVEMAIEMAIEKLSREAVLAVNFKEEFTWLCKKLTYVRGFLQDAARQREDAKDWLVKISIISWLAEDICEECVVESMYVNNAQSCVLSCNQWIFRYRMRRKIKAMKASIRSIIEEGEQLKLFHEISLVDEALPSTSRSVCWKGSDLLPSDSHPVGIQSKIADMLELLENPAFPVIAVVGTGGSGKTYLLQQLLNITSERYEKSIWLSVSQSYSISVLQKDLAFQLGIRDIMDDKISEQLAAAQLIHEKLQEKRYLVVLDDVWMVRREDDLLAKLGLPTGKDSLCKIVVTTRSKDVCRNLDAEMYEMKYLTEEESWSLFSFYAFREGREKTEQLEGVGRQIVKECGNLPLAIKTIGASLANTTIPWESKLRQLKGPLDDNSYDSILSVLRLSYESLPARLRTCFAYLSFFPEDEFIDCEYLINLWIGEGFILAGEDQWDMAWNCLHQLANLCFLELREEVKGIQLTRYCKIHDLLLDMAIYISRENCCTFSIEEASAYASSGTSCCRILLSKKDIDDNAISNRHLVCLRTLSLSQNEEITSIPSELFTAMRGLRVLDLSGTNISTLPSSVGMMKVLKLLNISNTRITEVPQCVRYLRSLLFLALPYDCSRLPVWICELKCLQHLECKSVDRMPKGISTLPSLRTLRSGRLELSIEVDNFIRLEDLATMTQLQELWLNLKHEMEFKRVEEGILAHLVKMRCLVVKSSIGHGMELPPFPEEMSTMKDLESLQLVNFAMPGWICAVSNLRELVLVGCDCYDYPELQRMPNLVNLVLGGNERCRELPNAFGESEGFPKLRFFTIEMFSSLEEFPDLEEGAMARLEEFRLQYCPNVKKVGEGLELLKGLKLLRYAYSGTNELREMFKEGGVYWSKIKKIMQKNRYSRNNCSEHSRALRQMFQMHALQIVCFHKRTKIPKYEWHFPQRGNGFLLFYSIIELLFRI